jgi:hypothetical protein
MLIRCQLDKNNAFITFQCSGMEPPEGGPDAALGVWVHERLEAVRIPDFCYQRLSSFPLVNPDV